MKNGDFLYHMIHNTPERLLAHEFADGESQFSAYYRSKYFTMLLSTYRSDNEWLSSTILGDTKYSWVDSVQLTKEDNA